MYKDAGNGPGHYGKAVVMGTNPAWLFAPAVIATSGLKGNPRMRYVRQGYMWYLAFPQGVSSMGFTYNQMVKRNPVPAP